MARTKKEKHKWYQWDPKEQPGRESEYMYTLDFAEKSLVSTLDVNVSTGRMDKDVGRPSVIILFLVQAKPVFSEKISRKLIRFIFDKRNFIK